MSVTAVAFDIDQTLWDFHAVRIEALRAVASLFAERATIPRDQLVPLLETDSLQARYDRLELQRPARQLAAIRGLALAEAAAEIAPGDERLPADATELYFRHRHAPRSPYPDTIPALTELRDSGLRLAIVSNGNTDLQAMGIAHFFDEVVLGPRVGTAKPYEEIYRLVERGLGVDAAELVCVGDDVDKDVCAPQRFGWRGVWNRRDAQATPPDCSPDATVELLTELPAVIDGWR